MKIAAIHNAPQVEQVATRSKRGGDKEARSGEISVSVSDSARFVSDVRDAAAEVSDVQADEIERAERDIADGQLEQRMDWDEVLNGLILEL
jgi:anti-sigma28 factor (negative regulator of flagellin synthesis)